VFQLQQIHRVPRLSQNVVESVQAPR
jgi:hypothetical protein